MPARVKVDAVLSNVAALDRRRGAARRGFAWDHFDIQIDLARDRWRFLSEPQAQRLVAAYGSRLPVADRDALGAFMANVM